MRRTTFRTLHGAMASLGGFLITLLVLACTKPDATRSLPDRDVARLDRGRIHLDTTQIRHLVPLAITLSAPSDSARTPHPQSVAFVGSPFCRIAVTDGFSAAIHLFTANGRFERSIPLPPIEDSLGVTYRTAIGSDGFMVVSEDTRGAIAVLSNGKLPWRAFTPTPLLRANRFGDALALTATGLIVDHWFSAGRTWDTDGWRADLPLMRVWTRDGKEIARLGHVELFEGRSFTVVLNRGIPVVDGDTVFFARRSDARVLKFSLTHGDERASPGIVDLPVGFEMRPPVEQSGGSEHPWRRIVEDHLTAFAVQPGGPFFAGIVMSYAPGDKPGLLPRGALAVFDRAGRQLGLFDVGGVIRALAVTPNRVFATVDEGLGRTPELRAFDNPLGRVQNIDRNANFIPLLRSRDHCGIPQTR